MGIRTFGSFGNLEATINLLNKEYTRLNSIFNDIPILLQSKFIYRPIRKRMLHSYANINYHWNHIEASLQTALVYLRLKHDTTVVTDIEATLQELDTLKNLQDDLHLIILEHNALQKPNIRRRFIADEEPFIIAQKASPVLKFYE